MDETTHSRIIKKGIIKNMEGATAIAKSPHVKQQNVLIQKAMQPRNYMNKLSTWWKQNQLQTKKRQLYDKMKMSLEKK